MTCELNCQCFFLTNIPIYSMHTLQRISSDFYYVNARNSNSNSKYSVYSSESDMETRKNIDLNKFNVRGIDDVFNLNTVFSVIVVVAIFTCVVLVVVFVAIACIIVIYIHFPLFCFQFEFFVCLCFQFIQTVPEHSTQVFLNVRT